MAKILIWPDIYKEQGHWLPTISMALRLQEAGHSVLFMGIKDCEEIVTPYGFPYHTIFEDIYPLGFTFNDNLRPTESRWKPHHLQPLASGRLDTFFEAENPDLIIGGYFTALETLILHYKYTVKFAIVTTYLRHPSRDPAMHALAKLVGMSKTEARKIMLLANKKGENKDIRAFVSPLDGATEAALPEFLVCPKEFDFAKERDRHLPNVKYIEPMVGRVIVNQGAIPSNLMIGQSPQERNVILGTAGSQVEDYLDKARKMFDCLIDMMAFRGMEDYKLVLAVGPRLYNEYVKKFAGNIPENISINIWVPQQDVLRKTAVIFTNGGLATLKEAIWGKVPIVIIPHGKDQVDNALRVRDAGVGLMEDISKITPTKLRQLTAKATTSQWIVKKLEKMHGIFHHYEVENPIFVNEIEKVLARADLL